MLIAGQPERYRLQWIPNATKIEAVYRETSDSTYQLVPPEEYRVEYVPGRGAWIIFDTEQVDFQDRPIPISVEGTTG